jgi:hypothetical protein
LAFAVLGYDIGARVVLAMGGAEEMDKAVEKAPPVRAPQQQ